MAINPNAAIPTTDIGFDDIYACWYKSVFTGQECDMGVLSGLYNGIYSGKTFEEVDHYKNVRCATLSFGTYSPPDFEDVAWSGTIPTVIMGITSAISVNWHVTFSVNVWSQAPQEAQASLQVKRNGSGYGGSGGIVQAQTIGGNDSDSKALTAIPLDFAATLEFDVNMSRTGVDTWARYEITIVGSTTTPTATLLPRRIFPYGAIGNIGGFI